MKQDPWQRALDTGQFVTTITRAKAEELVAALVATGEVRAQDARSRVDDLVGRSLRLQETLVAQIRLEVGSQLDALGMGSVESVARQVARLLGRSGAEGEHPAPVPATASPRTGTRPYSSTELPSTKVAVETAAPTKAKAKVTSADTEKGAKESKGSGSGSKAKAKASGPSGKRNDSPTQRNPSKQPSGKAAKAPKKSKVAEVSGPGPVDGGPPFVIESVPGQAATGASSKAGSGKTKSAKVGKKAGKKAGKNEVPDLRAGDPGHRSKAAL